jgi:sulfur-oxidizing protein SoxY
VLDAELDFSISENPSLRFNFLPHTAGATLRADVEDSKEGRYVGTLTVQ